MARWILHDRYLCRNAPNERSRNNLDCFADIRGRGLSQYRKGDTRIKRKIDECHRGSAAEDSAWREVLEYFNSATQIGLTATPKETVDVSNIDYFGEPTYIYSLKEGIEDGFLAPYKVVRVDIDIDCCNVSLVVCYLCSWYAV